MKVLLAEPFLLPLLTNKLVFALGVPQCQPLPRKDKTRIRNGSLNPLPWSQALQGVKGRALLQQFGFRHGTLLSCLFSNIF